MAEPAEILENAFRRAAASSGKSLIEDAAIRIRVDSVARNIKNRAGVRLLMSCLLAKIHRSNVDIRKPYTEIEGGDTFSGRRYDEAYITAFINKHQLPCNDTTAFLTPALRNIATTLTKDLVLVGRPREVYRNTLLLLDDVHERRVDAELLLAETIRVLILVRDENQARMQSLIEKLKTTTDAMPLSSEGIVSLISQHLNLPGSSRLPVLLVAAAYVAAESQIGERVKVLNAHNAADIQTGALGDVEITLVNEDEVVTSYEMKDKTVTVEDINRAIQKLNATGARVDNYIFITTDEIDKKVADYARSLYAETGGIEFAILDCVSFVRHFLHLFHRLRTKYLEAYQGLILSEPTSSVSQATKEAFLAMRQAAEEALG
jgi:hypothetical protein